MSFSLQAGEQVPFAAAVAVRGVVQGGDAFGATEPARALKHAEHHFEALDRFVIDVDRGPGQPPLKVVLEPQGLRWKVVDLQLGMSGSP